MSNLSFAFGKNWELFIQKYLNQERIEEAKKSLQEFLEGYELVGKSFVDAGCGSGLFSLAAYQLGAEKILSFDIDLDAVNCCRYLWEKAGKPNNWQIIQGSILDEDFISKLGKYDLVYSWGVLHHTGAMWKAIENVLKLVANKGFLYIAIYNKVDYFGFFPDGRIGSSKLWKIEKRLYTKLPHVFQNFVDYIVMVTLIILYLITFNNPIKKIRGHKSYRGMSWRVDIKDWLGGYPYEYASVSEVFNFIKRFGFSLRNLKCNPGLRNNEYLFYRYAGDEIN